jgi:hypothetical protein
MTNEPERIERTTEFVMSEVQAQPDTPVLFVKTTDGMLSLARLDDVQRLVRQAIKDAMLAAYTEIDEYVVAHTFDTTVGRNIDDFINMRMKAAMEMVDKAGE